MALQSDCSTYIRDRYTLLSKHLTSFPHLLSSLSEKLLEASLIDKGAAKTITNNGGRDGAHLLLDILELRLHQSQDYEPLIAGLLKDNKELKDLCEAPVSEKKGDTIQAQPIPPQEENKAPTILEDPAVGKVPTALAAAKILREHFGSILSLLTQALSNPSYNLDCLKVRISLYLQYAGMHRQNTPEVDQFLQDLEKCSSPSSIVDILTRSNLVSFLNFQLLDTVKSEEFDMHLERYALEYRAFSKHSINSIAEAFMRDPHLSTSLALRGLPEITVSLHSKLEARPYSQWLEIMEDNAQWSHHVLIKSIQINPIIITYYVLPFVWPKVVNDLGDDMAMIKRLNAIGATFTIPDRDLIDAGNKDHDRMKHEIQRVLIQLKLGSSATSSSSSKTGFTEEKSPSGSGVDSFGGYSRSLFCSPPPDKFDCLVCFCTAKDPLQCPDCGKIVCEGCYRSSECPNCRSEKPKMINDKRCRREIMNLRVKCTEKECYWTGTLRNRQHDCPQPKEKKQQQDEDEEMKSRAASAEGKKIFVQQKSDPTTSKKRRLEILHLQTSAPVPTTLHTEGSKGDSYVYTVTGLETERRIDWLDKGSIIIHVPAGVVPPDQTCDITITPVQPSECVFPTDVILVSEVFEVTTSCDLQAPITINLRHCVRPTREDERNCLSFAKAESTGSPPHVLREFEGGTFSTELQYGELKCTKFSYFSVFWLRRLGIPCSLHSCVQVGYRFCPESEEHEAHIIITKNIGKYAQRAVDSPHFKSQLRVNVTQTIEVIDHILVTMNEKSDDGSWKVTSKQEPCRIPKESIENYDGTQGAFPPSLGFSLLQEEEEEEGPCSSSARLKHTFNLTGAKQNPYSLKLCVSPHRGDRVKSMGLSVDESSRKQLDDEELRRLKQLIKRTVERKYSKLHSAIEHNLPQLARLLVEEDLYSLSSIKDADYEKIVDSVLSFIDLETSVSGMEESFRKFILALDAIGGSARKASQRLSTDLQSSVREELNFDFKVPHL